MNPTAKKWIWGKFSWRRLIRFPIILYIVLFCIGLFAPYRFIFPYRSCSYDSTLAGLHMIQSEDGKKVATVFYKAKAERYLALYFHGNGEDCGHVHHNIHNLSIRGISVLAMDYPGYGLSEGKPSEKSCQIAAKALYQRALEMGYHAEQIILWGRSVGGGIATNLSEVVDCRCLVLESPFATAFTTLTRVPIVPFDKFNNLSKIKKSKHPLFIFHGDKDRVIHPRYSEKLYNAHSAAKQRHLINGAGHNNLWQYDTTETMDALITFLN